MPSTITNLLIKDGSGALRLVRVIDLSGTGAGPFAPLHGIVDKDGTPIDAGNPLAIRDAAAGTKLDTLHGDLVALAGFSDGVEALLTTLNGYVDGLETLVGTSNSSLSALATLLTTLNTYTDGIEALIGATNTGNAAILTACQAATPAGSNLIGRTVADASAATGGIPSTARLASAAASTNATNVKIGAGRLYSAQGYNAAAYPVFLVLYDAVTNPPVPGTTGIRKKIPIPSGSAFALDWPLGLSFGTGIGFALTKLAADADTTAIAAGDVLQLNLDYA